MMHQCGTHPAPVRTWQQLQQRQAVTCRRPRRAACRCTGAGGQQQQQANNPSAEVYQQLVDWVSAQGGYVHPAISLADPAPCGTRGLVTRSPLSPGSVTPVLEIPLTARLTSPVALELLQPALSAAGMPTAGGLAEEDQLALAVAYLKVQGDASPWHPYIASLPAAPPCGWSKRGGQLAGDFDRCLHRHGVDLQWWQFFVGQATEQVNSQIGPLAARFGAVLGIGRDDLRWALAMVQSRRVAIDGEMVLEPLADLLNFAPPQSPASPAVTSDTSVTTTSSSSQGIASAGTDVSTARSSSQGVASAGTDTTAATASSSGREGSSRYAGVISWSYGVNRSRELVVSRGMLTSQRLVLTGATTNQQQQQQKTQQPSSTGSSNINNDNSSSSSSTESTPGEAAAEQKPVLPPGSELCVPLDPSWSTQSNTPGDADTEGAHLRPLAFYLQYGFVHDALGGMSLSRRHLLDPWTTTTTTTTTSTPLFDYLTEQYQSDVVEVLEALQSTQQRQPLLDWVLQPVNPPVNSPAASSSTEPQQVYVVLEPVQQAAVQRLDELILEAIDALEEQEAEADVEAAA